VNTPHTHVWCEACHAIRPLHIEDTHQDDTSGNYSEATDLQCAACGFVIATLYLSKAKTKAIEALQRRATE